MEKTLFFALIGGIAGSFLNVVIYRLPRILAGESLTLCWPASHCPVCKNNIRFYHNIPLLGWLWLRGRCIRCHSKIPVRYFLVELVMATLFPTMISLCGISWQSLVDLIVLSCLLPLFIIDLSCLLLPDRLTFTVMLSSLILAGLGEGRIDLSEAVIASVLGFGIPWLLDRFYLWRTGQHGMGMGDMKLFAGVGAWLGYEALMHIMLLASLMAMVMAVVILRKKRTEVFPFGPYLITGTLVVYLQPFLLG